MGNSTRAERSAAKLPTPYVVALPARAEPPPLREMVLDADTDEDAHAAVDPEPAPEARLTFVMIAPLMRDRGVFEFAEAARRAGGAAARRAFCVGRRRRRATRTA